MELNKNWQSREIHLRSHHNKALPVENTFNGFSQRQFWLLVPLDRIDLSGLTLGLMIYLVVSLIRPHVGQKSRAWSIHGVCLRNTPLD
jgi:K+-transporting ATPase KdpF subunit